MLNLKTPNFNFSSQENQYISDKLLLINGSNFDVKRDIKKAWPSQGNVYQKIRDTLYSNQDKKCAYWEMILKLTSPIEVDHFVDKSTYPKWMYHKENLIGACHYCNSTLKHCKSTVENPKNKINKYSDFDFIIVHPYLDKVSDYFEYNCNFLIEVNSKLTEYKKIKKASETIKMFGLNLAVRIQARSIMYKAAMYDCMSKESSLISLKTKDIDNMSPKEMRDHLKELQKMVNTYV